jgi:hypothetical protein
MKSSYVVRQSISDMIFSAFFGTQIFLLVMGGWSALNPRNYQWISGDNTSGYLAQLFYISDKWKFPLAANPNFGLDLSTSLTYSGPPLPIALIQKLFSIDPTLQFIGIWLLIMVILQIQFGIFIARQLNYGIIASRLVGLLFVTPFFLYRFQVHYWLTAHFLLLWAFWITLRSLSSSKLHTVEIAVFLIIAYSINTYILVMSVIILSYPIVLSIIRLRKFSPPIKKHLLILFSSLITTYFVFDFRSQKGTFLENLRMNFTGQYTEIPSNLLAFLNPEIGYSRDCNKGHCIFGGQPIPNHFIENFSVLKFDLGGVQGNYDAFLYLGLGLLLFLALAIYLFVQRNSPNLIIETLFKQKILIAYLVAISAYAITYKISIGNYQLDLGDPKLLRWALSIFRASGRFMWIIAYFFIILSLIIVVKSIKRKYLSALMLAVVLIQIVDLYPSLRNRSAALSELAITSVSINAELRASFKELAEGKDTLIMYPPGTQKGWPELAYLAWESGLKSGMSQSSRVNGELRSRLDPQILNMICGKELSSNILIAIPNDAIQKVEKCLDTYNYVTNLGGFAYISTRK